MLEILRATFTDNWIAWGYQYAVGGAFFAGTLWLGVRSGSLAPRTRAGRRLVAALVAGFLLFAAGHAAWIAAVQGPPGAMNQAEVDRLTAAAEARGARAGR
jgi:hypothetical protein